MFNNNFTLSYTDLRQGLTSIDASLNAKEVLFRGGSVFKSNLPSLYLHGKVETIE